MNLLYRNLPLNNLLACCSALSPFSCMKPLFFQLERTLSISSSHSDPPFCWHGAVPAQRDSLKLTSHDLDLRFCCFFWQRQL